MIYVSYMIFHSSLNKKYNIYAMDIHQKHILVIVQLPLLNILDSKDFSLIIHPPISALRFHKSILIKLQYPIISLLSLRQIARYILLLSTTDLK